MPTCDNVIAELADLIRNPRAPLSSRFRAQFLGIADDLTPLNLGITELRASEASAAMWEAMRMAWPPQAIGFRLLDISRSFHPRMTEATVSLSSTSEGVAMSVLKTRASLSLGLEGSKNRV
jgi:hypothetical protein